MSEELNEESKKALAMSPEEFFKTYCTVKLKTNKMDKDELRNEELPHQERMIIEADELTEKVEKLAEFVEGDVYKGLPDIPRQMLHIQLHAMTTYLTVLTYRVSNNF